MRTAPSHRMVETNVPRYTSYPTAPHFHAGIGPSAVNGWLDAVADGDAISLYLHIPFCDRLCWFCACHTKQTLRYEPVAAYLATLHKEIELIGRRLGGRGRVTTIHFGGGSPTMLHPSDLVALRSRIDACFAVEASASLSVEIDPNDIDEARLDALSEIGLTRASLGIQDFDPQVQKAINREQSFATTQCVVEGLRSRGLASINLDLLYGLPHQTVETLIATVRQSLSLRPNRIALFGYAHVPWFKKHQTMIDDAALPGLEARRGQSLAAADTIEASGYVRIGIDHFALPDDGLTLAARAGALHRNFQGYTDDACETLIGLGPSAISSYRAGYAQNTVAMGNYRNQIERGELAVARGIALTDDDRARRWLIERLMCDLGVSISELRRKHHVDAELMRDLTRLLNDSTLVEFDGDRVSIREPHVARTAAARFDRYLRQGEARYSVAV